MNLDVYNTHMELYPYVKDDFPIIEDMYTAEEKFTGERHACGYMIEDGKLFLPRGTSISKIENICKVKANIITESDPVGKMERNHSSLYDPKDAIQEESIKFLMGQDHQVGLNILMGFGKAQPLSTKIPTPDGYKLMRDLQIGDELFGGDGAITRVVGIFPQGVKDVYEVTLGDGRKTRCCKEHLWNYISTSTGRRGTIPLGTMMNDYKIYHHYGDEYRYGIPLLTSPVKYKHQDVPIDPYVMGVMIGSGCLKNEMLSIISTDNYIPSLISMKCGWKNHTSSGLNNEYVWTGTTYSFYKYTEDRDINILTKDIFSELPDLIGKEDYEKFIPEIYMYNDYETHIELLRGLLDSKGRISKRFGDINIIFQSSSDILLEQIQELIRGIGYVSEIYNRLITIIVPQDFSQELFTHPNKLQILKQKSLDSNNRQFEYLELKDISYVGKDECQCIMVDNNDHLYVTENFIVTHNTFCVAYTSSKLGIKTMIITPNEGLKQQWLSTYHKMFDYRTKDLINIAGGQVIDAIMGDYIEPADVYFVNHATLRNYMMETGGYSLHKFFKKLEVGIKVYDESHMEFGNILLMDFFSNTERTWYLTATFDRSDKDESKCFKRAFNSVVTFGETQSLEVLVKHVIYHKVEINSRISTQNRANVMGGYQGFTSTKYGKYAFIDDPNQTAYAAILEILKIVKDVEGKILIFVPLIDVADQVVKKLKLDQQDKSVAAFHSKISADEKESALKKDIIVSTIKSCGTGKDIPGLRCVICCEPVASKVIAKQMFGRLRPYADDKDTYFFDVVDVCLPPCNWWFRARIRVIQSLAKKVIYLDTTK